MACFEILEGAKLNKLTVQTGLHRDSDINAFGSEMNPMITYTVYSIADHQKEMILREFPDLLWLKRQIQTQFADRRAWDGRVLPKPTWPTVVINAKVSEAYRDNIKGPLSLFYTLSGKSCVSIDKRKFDVSEAYYSISNKDQLYTLEIDQDTEVETFNIHFENGFVRDACRAIFATDENLLDNKDNFSDQIFINRLIPASKQFHHLILQLKQNNNQMLHEELLVKVLYFVLQQENDFSNKIDLIPASKSSSRVEILKRLSLAKDYIYAFYHVPLTLDELAMASHLSKFHFLRLFKSTFGQTPYQFINSIRIDQAKKLLRSSHIEVREIAEKVGFENPSSFSRLFYKHTGLYPSQFRQ